jgi:DNA-directed RNA polymerase specialized sigma24 family protein
MLAESVLCRLPAVEKLAAEKYRHKGSFAAVHALRELLSVAIERAIEILPKKKAAFLNHYSAEMPITKIGRKLGIKSRSYLSSSYRPRVVAAVTREFLELVSSDEDRL